MGVEIPRPASGAPGVPLGACASDSDFVLNLMVRYFYEGATIGSLPSLLADEALAYRSHIPDPGQRWNLEQPLPREIAESLQRWMFPVRAEVLTKAYNSGLGTRFVLVQNVALELKTLIKVPKEPLRRDVIEAHGYVLNNPGFSLEEREHAAWSLGILGVAKASEALIRASRDKEKRIRLAAAAALAQIGTSQAIGHLENLIRAGRDSEILDIYRNAKGPAAGVLFQELADDEEVGPEVRFETAKTLAIMGDGKGEDLLQSYRVHGSPVQKAEVGAALKHLETHRRAKMMLGELEIPGHPGWSKPQAVAILSEALGNPDDALVIEAARVLGQLGDRRAAAGLRQLLHQGRNGWVQRAAVEALCRIHSPESRAQLALEVTLPTYPLVARAAARGLADEGDEGIRALVDVLKEFPEATAPAAVPALVGAGQRAVGPVAELLRHYDAQMSLIALRILAGISGEQATNELQEFLNTLPREMMEMMRSDEGLMARLRDLPELSLQLTRMGLDALPTGLNSQYPAEFEAAVLDMVSHPEGRKRFIFELYGDPELERSIAQNHHPGIQELYQWWRGLRDYLERLCHHASYPGQNPDLLLEFVRPLVGHEKVFAEAMAMSVSLPEPQRHVCTALLKQAMAMDQPAIDAADLRARLLDVLEQAQASPWVVPQKTTSLKKDSPLAFDIADLRRMNPKVYDIYRERIRTMLLDPLRALSFFHFLHMNAAGLNRRPPLGKPYVPTRELTDLLRFFREMGDRLNELSMVGEKIRTLRSVTEDQLDDYEARARFQALKIVLKEVAEELAASPIRRMLWNAWRDLPAAQVLLTLSGKVIPSLMLPWRTRAMLYFAAYDFIQRPSVRPQIERNLFLQLFVLPQDTNMADIYQCLSALISADRRNLAALNSTPLSREHPQEGLSVPWGVTSQLPDSIALAMRILSNPDVFDEEIQSRSAQFIVTQAERGARWPSFVMASLLAGDRIRPGIRKKLADFQERMLKAPAGPSVVPDSGQTSVEASL